MPALVTFIALLSTHAPSQMASDLTLAGFIVWEALSVSEVLHLCEHQNVDPVIIASDSRRPGDGRIADAADHRSAKRRRQRRGCPVGAIAVAAGAGRSGSVKHALEKQTPLPEARG